jgi:hypothetical protein
VVLNLTAKFMCIILANTYIMTFLIFALSQNGARRNDVLNCYQLLSFIAIVVAFVSCYSNVFLTVISVIMQPLCCCILRLSLYWHLHLSLGTFYAHMHSILHF